MLHLALMLSWTLGADQRALDVGGIESIEDLSRLVEQLKQEQVEAGVSALPGNCSNMPIFAFGNVSNMPIHVVGPVEPQEFLNFNVPSAGGQRLYEWVPAPR